jgi:hypothetical protein
MLDEDLKNEVLILDLYEEFRLLMNLKMVSLLHIRIKISKSNV